MLKLLRRVYGYNFELKQVEKVEDISEFNGSTVFISQQDEISHVDLTPKIDFFISIHGHLGSILFVNGEQNESYISEIQHVRRRETIAMTPADCFTALQTVDRKTASAQEERILKKTKRRVVDSIHDITATKSKALIASCGLSMQYAIMMGLIDDALEKHKGKAIKIIVPPNCYGGTNDQARRVAACIENVEVVDLPVDGDNDMVQSIDTVLDKVAQRRCCSLHHRRNSHKPKSGSSRS